MTTIRHPKCGKHFPHTSRAGHCGKCCETFIGLRAFDEHLAATSGHPVHLDPATATDTKGRPKPFWKDDRGYWHYGQKLTEAEKREIWGKQRSQQAPQPSIHPHAASEARRAAFLMPKERRDELDANDLRNLAEVPMEAYRDLTGSDDERTD